MVIVTFAIAIVFILLSRFVKIELFTMRLPPPKSFTDPFEHVRRTKRLAKALSKKDVYEWLVTRGYYPESYVLPPCFEVTKFHPFGSNPLCGRKKKNYSPPLTELVSMHFPKTDLTDRSFSTIEPDIHSAIAYWISSNWLTIMSEMFHKKNKVCAYSFPVPLDSGDVGNVGKLRSGRMIYEFIEMAENDLASIAYRFKYLFRTDIKNFYPSIYTHSISWAVHSKTTIRRGSNRFNYNFVGNRLDKLFQNANDGCTNGIPVGPAVSDIVSELILSRVDRLISDSYESDEAVVVRFKDDYRILCTKEEIGDRIIRKLQAALTEYSPELNDSKTSKYLLPDGLFRSWKSLYHAINPNPKLFYRYDRFKETYLAVLEIDKKCPGTGVIDRFLVDILRKGNRPNFTIKTKYLPPVISMLLMLGRLRIKAFPKVLGILEMILRRPHGADHTESIREHLEKLLEELCSSEPENKYLIMWIVYFLRSNKLESTVVKKIILKDPYARSTKTSRNHLFKNNTNFKIFTTVMDASKKITMLEHLDVFRPQDDV